VAHAVRGRRALLRDQPGRVPAVVREGSAAFGLIFYGWYDLFAAALVTQFFMATQFYFNARSAKRAYPLVIAGGSIGATLGGAITGFFAESVGTPNLLLVAAVADRRFARRRSRGCWADQCPAPRAGRPSVPARYPRGELRTSCSRTGRSG
jgi:hypothetical protein